MSEIGFFKNTLPEQIAIVAMLVVALWIVGYLLLYESYYKTWTCLECRKIVRGKICRRTGFRLNLLCSECSSTPITHAQYLRSFGIDKPKLTRVK